MGIIKEPKNVDFTIKSEPWTEKELADFREIMKQEKVKRARKQRTIQQKKRNKSTNAQIE